MPRAVDQHWGPGVVAIFLGVIAVLISWPGWSRLLEPRGMQTQGRVIRLQPMGRRGTVPVVHYQVGGKDFEVTGDPDFGSRGGYTVGEAVTVYYDAGNPGDGCIDLFWSGWFRALSFGGVGLLLLPFGIYLLWSGSRKARPHA
jgi:hypothetical protein